MDPISKTLPDSPSSQVIQEVAKHWWAFLVRGILLVLLGGYALTVPGLTLEVYIWMLGIFVIIDGFMVLVMGLTHQMDSRKWTVLRGLLTLLVGVFVVSYPLMIGAVVGVTLILILAFHAIVSGVLEIYVAFHDRKAIQGEGWMMLSGAFSILFGVALLSAPLLSVKVLIQISGVFAIFFGFATIFTAVRFKSLKKR